ncbi:DUF4352 domain-containing protein [Nocardia sp.]|uniref:DUF4352 domain-containing protein n=1 Tax=Nocardia sp. TaxID=1821 RepID=UPI0026359CEC|nr:DUF4352 domain-containing protein [Nocardia sp.]
MSTPNQPVPPPPGGPPMYGQGYPPPPRKKRKIWPWILLAVVVLFFGGCFALVGTAAHEVSKSTDKSTAVAAAGSEVRDGKFAFAVTAVDPPVAAVGDNEILRKTAQGEYVLVHVAITNIGDKAQSYFGENQKLIDDQGKQFSNDTSAELAVNQDLTAEINPGNKISVSIPFDVPKGTVPATVEFHDSMFSGGARVALK